MLIAHSEHPDGPASDQTTWKGGFLHQHERVEGVDIGAERSVDEPVVGRILGSGEQRPVQADPARRTVKQALVAGSLGDLDDDIELHDLPFDLLGYGGTRTGGTTSRPADGTRTHYPQSLPTDRATQRRA
jgi:hypothetical protein